MSGIPPPGSPLTTTSPRHQQLFDTLREAMEQSESRPLTIGEVVTRLRGDGLSLVSLVHTLPFLQPLSLGPISIVGGSALTMLGWQMVQGRTQPWLPDRMASVELSPRVWRVLLQTCTKLLTVTGRIAKPRLTGWVRGRAARRVAGAIVAAGGLLIVAPFPGIPFSNAFPALAVALVAIAEMEEDGLFMVGAVGALIASILYLGAVGFAAFEILQRLFAWCAALFVS